MVPTAFYDALAVSGVPGLGVFLQFGLAEREPVDGVDPLKAEGFKVVEVDYTMGERIFLVPSLMRGLLEALQNQAEKFPEAKSAKKPEKPEPERTGFSNPAYRDGYRDGYGDAVADLS